ncbi:MAG: hypothetical protein WDN23_07500 [Edaphobacter sp.]
MFTKNSAGLGVPRGSLGDLKGVSNAAAKHGVATMPVFAAGSGGAEAHGMSRGPVTLRQGSAFGSGGENGAFAATRQGGSECFGGFRGLGFGGCFGSWPRWRRDGIRWRRNVGWVWWGFGSQRWAWWGFE